MNPIFQAILFLEALLLSVIAVSEFIADMIKSSTNKDVKYKKFYLILACLCWAIFYYYL